MRKVTLGDADDPTVYDHRRRPPRAMAGTVVVATPPATVKRVAW